MVQLKEIKYMYIPILVQPVEPGPGVGPEVPSWADGGWPHVLQPSELDAEGPPGVHQPPPSRCCGIFRRPGGFGGGPSTPVCLCCVLFLATYKTE